MVAGDRCPRFLIVAITGGPLSIKLKTACHRRFALLALELPVARPSWAVGEELVVDFAISRRGGLRNRYGNITSATRSIRENTAEPENFKARAHRPAGGPVCGPAAGYSERMSLRSSTRKGVERTAMDFFRTHTRAMGTVSPSRLTMLGSSSAKEISSALNSR